MGRIGQLGLVAAGGSVGALVRWIISEASPSSDFPWPTLVVNVVGCALLALVTTGSSSIPQRRFLGTGFAGGLTTFSTLSLEIVMLVDDGRLATALIYVAASFLLGLVAFIGVRAMRGGAGERIVEAT